MDRNIVIIQADWRLFVWHHALELLAVVGWAFALGMWVGMLW